MVNPRDPDLKEVETHILEVFDQHGDDQVHTQNIAKATGITRHTAAKYLSVLEAKGHVGHDSVGNAKVWYPLTNRVEIRTLAPADEEEVLEIARANQEIERTEDEVFARNVRADYHSQLEQSRQFCLGAETDRHLVGFIIGDVHTWEFGAPVKAGWIRMLGVIPEYQGRGIGRRLIEELYDRFSAVDVRRVRTIVSWGDSDMLPFFHAIGFGMKESTVLEMEIPEMQHT